jgi:hypothetical protein
MSLNWNLSEIKNHDDLCWNEDETMNPVTHTMIFATMIVGLHGITEKNVGQFAARLELYQNLHGELMIGPDGPVAVTTEDVIDHIGLRCNVSDETDAAWIKRTVTDDLKRNGARYQRKFAESQEVAA